MKAPGWPIVDHVLLIEAPKGLVLVDSGFGLADCADPRGRLGALRHVLRPVLDPAQTAIRQIEARGFSADDVTDIIVTHFDLDHIGGLSDFPNARVHTTAAELLGSVTSPNRAERRRFRATQWAHNPPFVGYEPDGEPWRGFAAAKPLTGIADGIVLVSVPGHSRGHAAVAVDAGDRWLLHCGDAFYHRASIGGSGKVPLAARLSERVTPYDRRMMLANQERLAELYRRQDPDLVIFCSHDEQQFAALANA